MTLPDPQYIACFPLQETFINKDDGELLSGGSVYFWADQGYTIPKNVYQQTYTPGTDTYSYASLGPILTLSSIGSFQDGNGNQIIPFLKPYDASGNTELYFIQVFSSGGILQFTRDGWPPNINAGTSPTDTFEGSINEITNPQFVEVLFTPDPTTTTYSYTSLLSDTVEIAPGWSIISGGVGTITVSQVGVSSETTTNPPYALRVTSAGGVSSIKLRQTIAESPRLLYDGFIYGLLEARGITPFVNTISMSLIDSQGTTWTPINGQTTEASGAFTVLEGSAATTGTANTDVAPAGYVYVDIDFEALTTVEITSAQIVKTQNATSSTPFLPLSTPLQQSQLSYYWDPLLKIKPIPSYLTGWDFPLNPAQEFGDMVAASPIGANKSRYFWDQTIVFQTVDNTMSATRNADNNGFKLAASADTSFAVIQYLEGATVKEILSQRLSVKLKGSNSVGTLIGQVNLYWTTGATLPVLNTPDFLSLVSGVSATAVPTVGNGTWNKVPRSGLGVAPFQLTTTAQEFSFSGWKETVAITSATFFAIVISFSTMPLANTVTLEYCSLVGGDIPTRPAPQTPDDVLRECERYYETTFNVGTAAPTATFTGVRVQPMTAYWTAAAASAGVYPNSFGGEWKTMKRKVPTLTFYSGASTTANNVEAYINNTGTGTAQAEKILGSFWSSVTSSIKNYYVTSAVSGGALLSGGTGAHPGTGYIAYHYTAEARLGKVA